MTACPPGMVWLPGGSFVMGSDDHYPEERPAHRREVAGFWIDRAPVTVAQFAAFVAATGHVTLAETLGGSAVFRQPRAADLRRPDWWCWQPGTDWRGEGDLPVVHVGHADAEAYAAWAGKEIPTEAEWEFAARGGLDGADYSWGDEFTPDGRYMANTWQGEFPWQNRIDDGYEWTAPVGSFPANGYGLYDMAGNVWEWTADWYQTHDRIDSPCCTLDNPRGGARDDSIAADQGQVRIPRKVMKGGSYLCAPNYCRRYRPAARMAQPVDTSTCHLGFRCIRRASSGAPAHP